MRGVLLPQRRLRLNRYDRFAYDSRVPTMHRKSRCYIIKYKRIGRELKQIIRQEFVIILTLLAALRMLISEPSEKLGFARSLLVSIELFHYLYIL